MRTFSSTAHRTTLDQVATQFLSDSEKDVTRKAIEETTHVSRRAYIELYIAASREFGDGQPRFPHPVGHLPLADLTPAVLLQFRGRLVDRKLSMQSIKHIMLTIRLLLKWARFHNLMTSDPMKDLPPLRSRELQDEEDSEVIIPEKQVVSALLAVTTGLKNLFILMAASSGLRSSEQRALTWSHIDFEARRILVRRRVDRKGRFGVPKTKKGRRDIPMSPRLLEALEAHLSTTKFPGADDLVFSTSNGTPWSHSNLLKLVYNWAWRKAGERWAEAQPLERTSWHALRHFAISTWIERDVPIKSIQGWSGHATAAIILERYAHVFKAADHSAVIDEISESF